MPDTNPPVQGTPDLPYQPWNPSGEDTIAGWKSVDGNSGPADMQGNATGEFESGSGWTQT